MTTFGASAPLKKPERKFGFEKRAPKAPRVTSRSGLSSRRSTTSGGVLEGEGGEDLVCGRGWQGVEE
jgi:hypothetical protein